MLNDYRLTPTFSIRTQSLITYYWIKVTVSCYSLHDHWLLPRINALTLIHTLTCHYKGRFASNRATIYMLLISCPPYSFIIYCLDELRNMESSSWADHSVRAPRFSSHHIYYGATSPLADCHVPCLCWPHMCVSLEFPTHWIHFIFYQKTFLYSSSSSFSSLYTKLRVWN